ncbi:hypothetical protein CFP56_010704, partial [Quercus suber]
LVSVKSFLSSPNSSAPFDLLTFITLSLSGNLKEQNILFWSLSVAGGRFGGLVKKFKARVTKAILKSFVFKLSGGYEVGFYQIGEEMNIIVALDINEDATKYHLISNFGIGTVVHNSVLFNLLHSSTTKVVWLIAFTM